jgi:succinate dehydrogenase / fumarate reductase cytochrome b subunit
MVDVTVKRKRPLWYNLNLLKLPVPAIVSILHRISGALLFPLTFVVLYMLDRSLASPETFADTVRALSHPAMKALLLGLLWMLLHHLLAGIRYLLLDLHVGIALAPARASSYVVIVAALVLTLVIGGALLW